MLSHNIVLKNNYPKSQILEKEFSLSQTCNPKYKLRICGIIEFNNPYAARRMCVSIKRRGKRQDLEKQLKILYHSTTMESVEKLLKMPVDSLPNFKIRSSGVFGPGIYFSPDPNQCVISSKGKKEESYLLLRCIVFVGSKKNSYHVPKVMKVPLFDEYCIKKSSHVLITHILRCDVVKRVKTRKKCFYSGGMDASKSDCNLVFTKKCTLRRKIKNDAVNDMMKEDVENELSEVSEEDSNPVKYEKNEETIKSEESVEEKSSSNEEKDDEEKVSTDVNTGNDGNSNKHPESTFIIENKDDQEDNESTPLGNEDSNQEEIIENLKKRIEDETETD